MNPLIIIPTYIRSSSEANIVFKCVESTIKTAGYPLIVDDASPYRVAIDKLSEAGVKVVRKEINEGFAKTVNVGLQRALEEDRDAILVNADIEFAWDNWLDKLYEADSDVTGGMLYYPNSLIQHAGIYFSFITRSFDHLFKYAPHDLPEAYVKRVCPVTAALQLIRHSALERCGLYDEDFRMGWEDVAYCLSVFQKGLVCSFTPDTRAIHHESLFRGGRRKKIKNWEIESWKLLHSKFEGFDFSKFVPTHFNL